MAYRRPRDDDWNSEHRAEAPLQRADRNFTDLLQELRVLFTRAPKGARLAVIRGLFYARDEDGLIKIAGEEKDPALKADVVSKLRLLGTPKAKLYLETSKK